MRTHHSPAPTRRRVAPSTLLLVLLYAGAASAALAAEGADPSEAAIALGERLFRERNFTNPATDYGSSCAECHASGGEVSGRAPRVFADYTPQSLTATKETTLRNTPTLLGVGSHERFGWDGAYGSLEEIVLEKLVGPTLGWKDGDRERALAAVQFTLLEEGSGGGADPGYAAAFADAYGVELDQLDTESTVRQGARAIADYVRSLHSSRTAPWDAFVSMNRLHAGPVAGEAPEDYAFGVWSRIGNQEGRLLVKRPKGFTRDAYEGFKIFFRTAPEGDAPVGNCVVCHVPPTFTDARFHDAGVSEAAYDAVHGEGAAAKLEAPSTPSESTRAAPTADDPRRIDLGRFDAAPQEPGALGAFKTPTLRNLSGTDPYMHDGAYATLEDAVRAKIRAAEGARSGRLPWVDPEIAEIRIDEDDVAALVAFLRQLEDVGRERFREYLIELAED